MKEIKTVIYPIDDKDIFDKVVNNRLAKGWILKKRGTISVQGEPNEVGSTSTVVSLYAELVR